jgi:hypothetical protein
MRIVLVIGLILGTALLASCSSTGAYIGDNLPEWAGGLPKGTPPRPGSPGYDAYLRSLSGDHTGTAQPAEQASPPPREAKEPVDEPIH